jgi:hypothetical protein
MKPAWLNKLSPAWRARMVRLGFNFHPAFRGTGGRVTHVAKDLRHIRIRLPLTWKTRNIVGSLYGGSLFAITDGAHPMMLMAALGDDYIIWDKAASIRYRKPGFQRCMPISFWMMLSWPRSGPDWQRTRRLNEPIWSN